MNRYEAQQVGEIIDLWLSFVVKNEKYDGIAYSGPSPLGLFSEFKGEVPDAGGFKSDSVGDKAEKMEGIEITQRERDARKILMSLPMDQRFCATIWHQIKKTHNPITGEMHKEEDSLEYLSKAGLRATFDEYLFIKKLGEHSLLYLSKKAGFRTSRNIT